MMFGALDDSQMISLLTFLFAIYGLLKLGFGRILLSWIFSFVGLCSSEAYESALRKADTMATPTTGKHSQRGENKILKYGLSSMQGWRRSMEDAHIADVDVEDIGSFFAVFDGHCGSSVASYCAEHLLTFVKKALLKFRDDVAKALCESFVHIDRHIHSTIPLERSGCTAAALIVSESGKYLFCANVGDSRCVLCRNGVCIPLSDDHKPSNDVERDRILRAGGFVHRNRVNGTLALSRAIGDFGFKGNSKMSWDEQAVTSVPDVMRLAINTELDEFVVIACDGIWDVMSNEQVIGFVRSRIELGFALDKICEELMNTCLSPHPFGLGCDNMSVIIVQFCGSNLFRRTMTHQTGLLARSLCVEQVETVCSAKLSEDLLDKTLTVEDDSCGESREVAYSSLSAESAHATIAAPIDVQPLGRVGGS